MRTPHPRSGPARPSRRALLGGLAAAALLAGPARAAQGAPAGLTLLMIERDGCSYCRRWDEEIASAYPRTAEGAAAPLLRHDIGAPLPAGVVLTGRPPVFTPTFVLLRDGTETGRIEGYAGDEFFWGLMADLLADAGWTPPPPGATPGATPGTPPATDAPAAPTTSPEPGKDSP